jgi:dinuclear metal center YbgI/SA1388 family protein
MNFNPRQSWWGFCLSRIFVAMLITEFLTALEKVVPLTAVGYDKDAVGLQIGLPNETELKRALFAYETTNDVIAEAKKDGANLIVAFHPLIFPTVNAITDRTRTGSLIRELVKNDIALYIQHTAFDTNLEFGTSRQMADALGLQHAKLLSPISVENSGMGMIGDLPKAMTRDELLARVAETFGTACVRHNSRSTDEIRKVGVLGGAGMDFYSAAKAQGAEAFITADVRYHDFHRADHDRILLIDAGHAETERFVTRGMALAARRALEVLNLWSGLPEDVIMTSKNEPNAVRYYCHT